MNQSTEILPTIKSRYNREVYKDVCLICGSHTELHTHHLIPQKLADDKGFIEDMHKNLAGNLVTLCKTCHDKIHGEKLELKRVETVTGSAIVLNG